MLTDSSKCVEFVCAKCQCFSWKCVPGCLVREMLESYQEGLGLILIGFFNKRRVFLIRLYSKYNKEAPASVLQTNFPGSKELADHPDLFTLIQSAFQRCVSMSGSLRTSQDTRESIAPGKEFFDSLEKYQASKSQLSEMG